MVLCKSAHISPHNNKTSQLSEVLLKFPTLFNGELKKYMGVLVHRELMLGAIPYCLQACPIPCAQLQVVKEELDCLVKSRILEPAMHSEWIAGTFIHAKKDGRACWILDFCGLNKHLKEKVYPLQKSQNTKCTGCGFFTKIGFVNPILHIQDG